jgi:hypothetical protein
MNTINECTISGCKRTRDEAVGFEQKKRQKIAYQNPLYVSRIQFMLLSLGGIDMALSQGIQLHQEQRDRLIVFVNDIDQMQQEEYISKDNLKKILNLLSSICRKNEAVYQNIGQKIFHLSEFI